MNVKFLGYALVSLWLYGQAHAQTQSAVDEPIPVLDSTFAPVKVIGRDVIARMGTSNLAEVLRYELNIEIEQAPATGGARTRTFDLNSRYFKVLIDGIPVAGSDLFGGHIDVSSISLYNVEAIEITHAPMGVEYGSGTLAGVVNVRTASHRHPQPTAIRASVQEESVGSEYNLQTGNGAKGRHIQYLGISHRLSDRFAIGANIARDAFAGQWGEYKGKQYADELTYMRGYDWSPRTTWNADGFITYTGNNFKARYHYGVSRSDITSYSRTNEELYAGDGALPQYAATDYRYVYGRGLHHLQITGEFWRNAAYALDASLQNGVTKRQTRLVNTATNALLEDSPMPELYATRTVYSRGSLTKPFVSGKLRWFTGYELDHTNGYLAVEPGTYVSREVDRGVFTLAGFTSIRWAPLERLTLQPGVRLTHSDVSGTHASPSFGVHYGLGNRNDLNLVAERVNRFPYHRELFTYLESEFSLLEGNTDLKPETGHALLLSWQSRIRDGEGFRLQTEVQSGFRQLNGRIAIEAIPSDVPMQDRYRYNNLREHRSWHNRVGVQVATPAFALDAAVSFIGLKGDDVGDASQYDKYLFHVQAGANVTYTLGGGHWLQANYRHVGSQPIYSFERELPNPEIIRVHNRAPAFNLLDINAGTSFFRKHLELSAGIRNVFDATSVEFWATDGQEHYRGDLRTQYVGYGRGLYLRVGYRL